MQRQQVFSARIISYLLEEEQGGGGSDFLGCSLILFEHPIQFGAF